MEPLKNTLDALMLGLAGKKAGSPGAAPEQWLKKTLTKKELQHIKVKYFSKGVLGLSVDSSAWLYQMSLGKEKLLSKLRAKIENLKEIRFFVGE